MSPREVLQKVLRHTPSGLLVLAALLGFAYLTRGTSHSRGAFTAYAEAQVHMVAPMLAGRLKAVHVQLGQRVKQGDVIALMDDRAVLLQRERVTALLQQARAQLEAERDLQDASLQRGQLQAVRSRAAQERSRAELRELDKQVARLDALTQDHLVKASELEAARRRQQAVAADLEARSLGTIREEEQMGLRPRTKAEQQHRLALRLAPFEAAVRAQEAALRELDQTIAEHTLKAPVDGIVGEILHRPGDTLPAATVIVNLVRARPGHVIAYLPERHVGGVAVGQLATLRKFGQLQGTQRGKVAELAPIIDEVPPRARQAPTVPQWARRVVIVLSQETPLLPGEAFHVTLD